MAGRSNGMFIIVLNEFIERNIESYEVAQVAEIIHHWSHLSSIVYTIVADDLTTRNQGTSSHGIEQTRLFQLLKFTPMPNLGPFSLTVNAD